MRPLTALKAQIAGASVTKKQKLLNAPRGAVSNADLNPFIKHKRSQLKNMVK